MSWQYLRVADEIAELLRLKRQTTGRGAVSSGASQQIDARIQQLANDDGNGGCER